MAQQQTPGSIRALLASITAFAKDVVPALALVSAVGYAAGLALWNQNRDAILDALGIASLADLEALQSEVHILTGKGRVIFEEPERYYVIEPAHLGEPIILSIRIGRTVAGLSCDFIGGSAIFANRQYEMIAGGRLTVVTQLTTKPQTLFIPIQLPPNPVGEEMKPGRTEVWLQLEYNCDDGPRSETTRRVVFDLQPRRQGE